MGLKMKTSTLSAKNLVLGMIKGFPNYAPEMHPHWKNAMAKYGADIDFSDTDNNDSLAIFVDTKNFDFTHIDAANSTNKAILMQAPSAFALELGSLFENPYKLIEQPALNLSHCDAVAQWKSSEEFTFEMNAKMIFKIANSEKEMLYKNDFLQIPIIIHCGRCFYIHHIKLDMAIYQQMKKMVDDCNNNWSPEKLPKEKQESLLKIFEIAVDEGMYPPHGFILRDYLRVTTPYDVN